MHGTVDTSMGNRHQGNVEKSRQRRSRPFAVIARIRNWQEARSDRQPLAYRLLRSPHGIERIVPGKSFFHS